MKKAVLEGLVVASLIIGFDVQGWAQQQPAPQRPDIGKTEYESVARRAMAPTEKERDQ